MKWKLRYFSPKQTTQELWHHHTKGTLPLQTHLLWINGCDWPEYPRLAGDLCECYGGQIHLSEQMKHELADSSGSQTTLSLKHYRITRVSEGRKKKGERHLETSIIDHFLEESECLFFFPINVHAFTFCLHFLICIQLYSFSDSCTWFFFCCLLSKEKQPQHRQENTIHLPLQP